VSELDPRQTIIQLPSEIPWRTPQGAPESSVQEATLAGGEEVEGIYLVLMRWYPGYMSAPHHYATDRLCVVLSGVWWCNSGPDFDPDHTVPAYPGSFVRRVANTPHYDGAKATALEPVVIAVTGMGPVNQIWVDPSESPLRKI
jgi:hypothetical protein